MLNNIIVRYMKCVRVCVCVLLSSVALVCTRLFGGCIVIDRQVCLPESIFFSSSLYVCLLVWEMLPKQSTNLFIFFFFFFFVLFYFTIMLDTMVID